jgi:hypothetical protein
MIHDFYISTGQRMKHIKKGAKNDNIFSDKVKTKFPSVSKAKKGSFKARLQIRRQPESTIPNSKFPSGRLAGEGFSFQGTG